MGKTFEQWFSRWFGWLAAAALSMIGGAVVALAAVVVNEQVWRPLQFSSAHGLLRVWASEDANERSAITPAIGSLLERATSFAEVASFVGHVSEIGSDRAGAQAASVAGTFFDVLEAVPLDGRLLMSSDDHRAAPPVCVLARSRWRREFADVFSPGQRVRVDGVEREVVGLLPDDFDFPGALTEVWLPRSTGVMANLRPKARGLGAIARLREGETVRTANAELEVLSAAATRVSNGDVRIWSEPLPESLGLRTRGSVAFLGMGVFLVLIATIGNLVALQLARLRSQRASLAIRSALGAQRYRLVSASTAELAKPIILGSVMAVPAAWAIGRSIQAPREVLLVGALLAACAALLAILVASLLSLRTASLSSERHPRGMKWLVLLEAICAYCLVAMAVALAQHHWRLSSADLGFSDDLVIVEVRFPVERFPLEVGDPTSWSANHDRAELLIGAFRREPLLSTSALGMVYPLTPGWTRRYVAPQGRGEIRFRAVGDGYFEAAQIDRLRGRGFSASDRLGKPSVAILNELAVALLFGDDDPLERSFVIEGVERQVVGVVRDTRFLDIGRPPEPAVFVPYSQTPAGFFFLTVRNPLAGARVHARVRSVTEDLVPGAQVLMGPDVEGVIASRLSSVKRRATVTALGAVTVVVLSLIATFVLSSTLGLTARREIAIRQAVGCGSLAATLALVWKSLSPVLGGIALGAPVGAAVSQILLPATSASVSSALAAQGAAMLLGILVSLAVAVPHAVACALSPLTRLLNAT